MAAEIGAAGICSPKCLLRAPITVVEQAAENGLFCDEIIKSNSESAVCSFRSYANIVKKAITDAECGDSCYIAAAVGQIPRAR